MYIDVYFGTIEPFVKSQFNRRIRTCFFFFTKITLIMYRLIQEGAFRELYRMCGKTKFRSTVFFIDLSSYSVENNFLGSYFIMRLRKRC